MNKYQSQKRGAILPMPKRLDSEFGIEVKKYLSDFGFTQTDLADASGIRKDILSNMLKGERTTGGGARHRLRSIILGLHILGALQTLEEANNLLLKVPAVSSLDERETEDIELINLLKSTSPEQETLSDPLPDPPASDPKTGANSPDNSENTLKESVDEIIPELQLTKKSPFAFRAISLRSGQLLFAGVGMILLVLVMVIGYFTLSGLTGAKATTGNETPTVGVYGGFRVTKKLTISPSSPVVGDVITATFTVRNLNTFPITIPVFSLGVRSIQVPASTCQDNTWDNPSIDVFEPVINHNFQGGEEYIYQKSAIINTPGNYFAEPVQNGNNKWGGILFTGTSPSSWSRECFTIQPKRAV